MKALTYDNPNDIESVELRIQAASGNISPVIYANGRNQLAVEIIVKAMKEDEDGNEVTLNFSNDEWVHILNLRHAESDEKLTRQSSSGWCFTSNENAYAREITGSTTADGSSFTPAVRLFASGSTLIKLYIYTDDVNTKRIAVSIDTDNGKHFTTADNATGAEKSSVTVRAVTPVNYDHAQNLHVIQGSWIDEINPLHHYSQQHSAGWSYSHYNSAIRQKRFSIMTVNGYKIVKKSASDALLPNHPEKNWFHNYTLPHAFSLASLNDGGYLNSWFVEPNGAERGYGAGMNEGYTQMEHAGWPSPYFCGQPSGEYVGLNWVYWPHIGTDDTRGWDKLPAHADEVSVYCYQLHIPNSSEIYWGLHSRPDYTTAPAVTVTITDNYGNEGSFLLTFNPDEAGTVTVSPGP